MNGEGFVVQTLFENIAMGATAFPDEGDSRKPRVAALGFRYLAGRAVYAALSSPARLFAGER